MTTRTTLILLSILFFLLGFWYGEMAMAYRFLDLNEILCKRILTK